jgi:hypothetical protein
MSRTILLAVILVAAVAACAKKEEVTYVEQPVTTEPVFSGKYN